MFWSKATNIIAIVFSGMVSSFFTMGCSEKPSTWYEDSYTTKQYKEERIEDLGEVGIDPVEASRMWSLEHSINQTHDLMSGGEQVLEGEQLREVLRDP